MRRAQALLAVLLAGCAHHAQDLTDAPTPPRGQPSPRIGELPPPPPNPGAQPPDTVEQQQRFGELQGQAVKEKARSQAQQKVAVVRYFNKEEMQDPASGGKPVEDCLNVPPRDRVGCPIVPESVEKIEDVPGGARLTMKAGGPSAGAVNRAVACQKAMTATGGANSRPLCPFDDGQSTIAAHADGSRTIIDLTGGDVRTLRVRVKAAFGR